MTKAQNAKVIDDEVGEWTEAKLAILQSYLPIYTSILSKQKKAPLTYWYIDAFASSGMHISKQTQETIMGSPMIALQCDPPFQAYHFIDLDGDKVAALEERIYGARPPGVAVTVHHGDATKVMVEQILPFVRYEFFCRGVCFLDPYAMHFGWDLVKAIAATRAVEVFLHFPIMDMNRNVLRRDGAGVSRDQQDRMIRFWGDQTWKTTAYPTTQPSLFDEMAGRETKALSNLQLVEAYRQRLIKDAGFPFVPAPVAMRNSIDRDIYYLFFASHNSIGHDRVVEIFDAYREQAGQTWRVDQASSGPRRRGTRSPAVPR